MKKGDMQGPSHMGPSCHLGQANEARLVKHIKAMQANGFPMNRDDVRKLAYNFAEKLGLKHSFNREKEKAGYPWLLRFMRDHPDLSVRTSEGVSLARVQGMNKEEVSNYFNLLQSILEKNGLIDKPSALFNGDETRLQLNNKPGKEIVEKGSKVVSSVTSGEKGETVTVLTYIYSTILYNEGEKLEERMERWNATWFVYYDVSEVSLCYHRNILLLA
ncbi:Tc5 transposase DNA-binding domain [Popillia japonica]|uniref:Tc5 transposase DNA-binding domain n=1 Tax=Popillia japonica TaxID=7064 RepID=A0AAW1HGM4_POPJA